MALHCLQQVLKEYLSSHIVDARNLEELILKVVAYFTQDISLFNMGTTFLTADLYQIYFSPQKIFPLYLYIFPFLYKIIYDCKYSLCMDC